MSVRVDCDLTFSYQPETTRSGEAERVLAFGGHRGRRDVNTLPGLERRRLRPLTRDLAEALHGQGLALRVTTPAGDQVVLGRGVRGGFLSWLATGSRRVKVLDWRSAIASIRRQGSPGAPQVTLAAMLPPPTPMPLAPTFRRLAYSIRTTHDPAGGGRPRLYFAAPTVMAGQQPRVHHLPQGGP